MQLKKQALCLLPLIGLAYSASQLIDPATARTGSPKRLPFSSLLSRKVQCLSEIKEVSTGLTWLNHIAL